jgi:hypothetical protein
VAGLRAGEPATADEASEAGCGARPHQLLHLFIATGLCGSLTTFSSWAAESNKLALLQLDASSGQFGATYNGGRALEWLLAQAIDRQMVQALDVIRVDIGQ